MVVEVTRDILTEIGGADGTALKLYNRNEHHKILLFGYNRVLTCSQCTGYEVVVCLPIFQNPRHSDRILCSLLQITQCILCSSDICYNTKVYETLNVVNVRVRNVVENNAS